MTEQDTNLVCRRCKDSIVAHDEMGCGNHLGGGRWCKCKATPEMIERELEIGTLPPPPAPDEAGYPSPAERAERH